MASLKGSKSFENLKEAFAGESQANRRYLYFARVADIEGFPDIAGLFKDTADAETGHAFGHLDFLKEVGDPVTGEPIGKTEKNLKSAVAGETYEYTQMSRAWPRPRAPRASTSWRSGLRRSPKRKSRTLAGSTRVCSRSPAKIRLKRFSYDGLPAGGGRGEGSWDHAALLRCPAAAGLHPGERRPPTRGGNGSHDPSPRPPPAGSPCDS